MDQPKPTDRIELLRFTTAGSVDDGKSTLIGRLLYDSKSIFEDQMEALQRSTDLTGGGQVNLANLTDGLRAEREQGITIDVAYRYFATPRRKFIVADTPGHVQYTRNMVTGASTANLAIILIDARQGVVQQTRRHAYIASLLGIPHLVICVNKMDLVEYSQSVFDAIEADFQQFATRLREQDITFIPVSALNGDNIVDRSDKMPWYQGPILLSHLEEVYIANDRNLDDPRFPVQYVVRPYTDEHHDFRGFAGTVAGGVFRPGQPIMVLPSGRMSKLKEIYTHNGPVDIAYSPMSVTLLLEDDVDVSRGDMLVDPENLPYTNDHFEAMVCWMDDQPMNMARKYIIKHLTHSARAMIKGIVHRMDIDNLEPIEGGTTLALNEIGRLKLRTTTPLMFDAYERNRQTGGFILIDEVTHRTVAAGMICEPAKDRPATESDGFVI
jgi:bifunctional enzyme CysN/CysC